MSSDQSGPYGSTKGPHAPVKHRWDHPGHLPILLYNKHLCRKAARVAFCPVERYTAWRIGFMCTAL